MDDRPRLERAPGRRYAATDEATDAERRRVLSGQVAIVVIGGALAITILGGLLEVGIGLLAVAAVVGWLVGTAFRSGSVEVGRSTALRAVVFAVGSVVLGQIGLWLLGRVEGGVLDPLTYLAEVFGLLVVGQLIAAAVSSAWTAR